MEIFRSLHGEYREISQLQNEIIKLQQDIIKLLKEKTEFPIEKTTINFECEKCMKKEEIPVLEAILYGAPVCQDCNLEMDCNDKITII